MRSGLVLVLLLAGCFRPTPSTGAPCGAARSCPAPLVCAATGTCEAAETDAPTDVAITGDAPVGDLDHDGVPDDVDNCPAAANLDQADEDGDHVGNACDNCPTVANLDQLDTSELAMTMGSVLPDGVGDACDPNPASRDRIALFESFDAPLVGWSTGGTAIVAGGRLHLDDGYARPPQSSQAGVAVTHFTLDTLATTRPYRSIEVAGPYDPAAGTAHGYRCGIFDNPTTTTSLRLKIQGYAPPYDLATGASHTGNLAAGESGDLRIRYGAAVACTSDTLGETVTLGNGETPTAPPGVGDQTLSAYFDYLIVYEPVP